MASPQLEKGYIKLHRKITETSFYKHPEVCHLAIHLILKANHESKKIIFNQRELKIGRGQYVTGRYELSKETGISESSIYRGLQILEKVGFLKIESNNKYSIISVCRYGQYQNKPTVERTTKNHRHKPDGKPLFNKTVKIEQQSEQQICDDNSKKSNSKANNQRTTTEQQLNTNKNDKNEKNEKNIASDQPMGVDFKKDCLKSLGVKCKVKGNDFSKLTNGGNGSRVIEEIVRVTSDGKSVPFWIKAYNVLGEGILEEELGELKYQMRISEIKNPAKYFVGLLKKRMGVIK